MTATFTESQLPNQYRTILFNMFDNNIDFMIEKIRKNMQEPVGTCDL